MIKNKQTINDIIVPKLKYHLTLDYCDLKGYFSIKKNKMIEPLAL